MKSFKKIVFLILCGMMFVPTFVKADISPPQRSNLNGHIINSNGINVNCYNYKTKQSEDIFIPFGERIVVQYEWENKADITYNTNYSCDIDYKDFSYENSDVFSFKYLKDHFYTVENTEVYSFPSFISKKVGEIPKDKELRLMEDPEKYFDAWKYVEYNDVKGWVYVFNYTTSEESSDKAKTSTLATMTSGSFMYINSKYSVYKDQMLTQISDIKLEYGKNYNYDLMVKEVSKNQVRIQIDGNYYWIETEHQAKESSDHILFPVKKRGSQTAIELYKRANDDTSKVMVNVDFNNIYYSFYVSNPRYDDSWVMIRVDGNEYWGTSGYYGFRKGDYQITLGSYRYENIKTPLEYYDGTLFENKLGVLEPGRYEYFDFDGGYYIKDKGYVRSLSDESISTTTTTTTTEVDYEEIYEDEDPYEVEFDYDDEEDDKSLNPLIFVILGLSLAVGGGVAIALITTKNRRDKEAAVDKILEEVKEAKAEKDKLIDKKEEIDKEKEIEKEDEEEVVEKEDKDEEDNTSSEE